MPILTERVTWRRPRKRRAPDLTPEEQANVRAALRFLRVRFGGYPHLATAMGMKTKSLQQATMRVRRSLTAAMALRTAKIAGVAIADVLTGAFPEPGACVRCGGPCPLCGRVT